MLALALLSLYVAAMIGIGVWGLRRTKTLGDFFLGGRTVGPWVSAVAYGTTYFSAVLFIGFAGSLGWSLGLNALWIAAGNVLFGSLLAWLVLGRRTRRLTQNLDVMTLPEFFAERFQAPWLKPFAALIVFVFLIPYSASVFKGLGHLFEASFHISFDGALLLMTVLTGLYLILGGYFAVTLTDFVQGLVMLVGALAMVALLVGRAGGPAAALAGIRAAYPAHVPTPPPWCLLASLVFMTSFGPWGLPQMVQKFYAIKNEQVIRVAAVVTTLFAAVIVFAAYFTGALTHAFYERLPEFGPDTFDRLIPDLLTRLLPAPLMAVILLLILSASMSTLSSLVLVAASAVAIDLYRGCLRPAARPGATLALMRLLSGVFVALSYVLARYRFEVIVTLMSLSWGAVAGAFMAPYLYGLYWRRCTRAGVLAGMATGLLLAVGLFFRLGPQRSPLAASLAMLAPLLVVPLVSWFTRPPPAALLERAFARRGEP